ncbi:hypothetical protein NPIL_169591 [Nephila pilipes]|uniref:Uncharacterized protein n=1 Tax=Nephila pilipes TaxID=299642 RepID=A0A8X6MEE2_NEPPI|nr:hypothetical protein NPIL_169591 [Nephila pilipes]
MKKNGYENIIRRHVCKSDQSVNLGSCYETLKPNGWDRHLHDVASIANSMVRGLRLIAMGDASYPSFLAL